MQQVVEAFEIPAGFEAYQDGIVAVPPALQDTGAPSIDALCPPSRKASCRVITPTPVWIRALGVVEDSEETLVQLAFRDGTTEDVRTIWCDRWQIAAKTPLVRLAAEGLPVTDASAAPLSAFLMTGLVQCASSLPRVLFRSRVGRVDRPDASGWLWGSSFIGSGARAVDPRIATPFTAGLHESIGPHSDRAAAMDEWLAMQNIIQSVGPGARWLSAVPFAAPLLALLNQRTFIVHHYGPSAGKTAVARFAQSAWGDPHALTLPCAGIKRSLMNVFSEVSDFPVFFDNAAGLDLDIAAVVSDLTAERARLRKPTSGTNKLAATWRTIIRFTGDTALVGKNGRSDLGGQSGRVIQLGMPVLENEEALVLNRWLDRKVYGLAGPDFLRGLLTQDVGHLSSLFDSARLAVAQKLSSELQAHAPHYAVVALAQALCSHIFTGADLPLALTAAISDAVAVVQLAADAAIADCPEAHALQLLHDHLHQHRRLWISTSDRFQWEQLKKGSYRNLVGVITPDEVWLIQRAANEILRQAGVDTLTVWRRLDALKLLVKQHSQEGLSSSRVIGGFSTRCYVLRRVPGAIANPFAKILDTVAESSVAPDDGIPLPDAILSELENLTGDN